MGEDHAPTVDAELLDTARRHKSELLAKMFGVDALVVDAEPVGGVLPMGSNIIGVGYGAKVTAGASVYDGPAVRVYVRAKLPVASLSGPDIVPPDVNGTPTDVVPVGDLVALARPVMCGVSCGHYAVSAGTLGCLVRRDAHIDQRYVLSNNHVLANSNNATVGDAILEPAPMDGGDTNDPIAELTDFQAIDFAGSNHIDAAIARVLDPASIKPEILGGIGRVQQPVMPAALYQSVRKHGRTTLHTIGIVMDLAADILVRYDKRVASFRDQIAIIGAGGAFGSGGDSGSLVAACGTPLRGRSWQRVRKPGRAGPRPLRCRDLVRQVLFVW